MKPVNAWETSQPVRVVTTPDKKKHEFYEITQSDQILHSRYLMAEIQEMYIRMGISEEFMKRVSQLLIDRAMEAKDLKALKEDVIAVGQNLKGRLGFIAEAKMYERMACVYYVMKGEPAEWSEEWQAKKVQIWKEGKDSEFFIMAAFRRTTALADISDSDILAALTAAGERIMQLPQI